MNEYEQKKQKNAKEIEYCEKMLTVKTAANLLGVSQNYIRNLIKAKRLRAAQDKRTSGIFSITPLDRY